MTHQSLPPDSNARFRTDARPFGDISERDADALDAWLDRHSAATRTGEYLSPADHNNFGQNGQTPAANDVPAPLTAAAQRFHARLESAERNDAPAIPESAIWENVMSSHLAINRPISPRTIPIKDKTSGASSRPHRTIVGSNPALSVMLAAALLIAIVTVFRGFNGSSPIAPPPPLNGGGSDYGFSVFTTPDASSASASCEMREVNADTAKRLEEARLAAPAPVYLPVQGPAPISDGNAAFSSFLTGMDCSMTTDPKGNLFTNPGWTDRYFADEQLQKNIETRVIVREQRLATSRELSPILTVPDPTAYVFDLDDPAVKPFQFFIGTGYSYVLFPDQFVILADGRIAAPTNLAIPGGTQSYAKSAFTPWVIIPFTIFANVNGNWLLDEVARLCVIACDEYYSSEQAAIDNDLAQIAASTPGPSVTNESPPIATPTSSSSSCEMREVSANEAARLKSERLAAPAPDYLPTQGAAPASASDAAIESFIYNQSCTISTDPQGKLFKSPGWTDRLFAESQLQSNTDSRVILRQQRLASSRELSPILAIPDPTTYIFDADDPTVKPFLIYSGIGNPNVLFPDQFVTLADGRIAAPMNWAIPGGAEGYTKDDYTSSVAVTFLIFANTNGNWLLDETVQLCTVFCDQFYASEQAAIDNDLAWIAARPTPNATAVAPTTTMAPDENVMLPIPTAPVGAPSPTSQQTGGDNQPTGPTPGSAEGEHKPSTSHPGEVHVRPETLPQRLLSSLTHTGASFGRCNTTSRHPDHVDDTNYLTIPTNTIGSYVIDTNSNT